MKPEYVLVESLEKDTLVVSGDLVARFNDQFKSELASFLKPKDVLELSLLHVESMDVTAIQLVYTFEGLVRKMNKKLQIVPPSDIQLVSLLERTGFFSMFKTLGGSSNDSL